MCSSWKWRLRLPGPSGIEVYAQNSVRGLRRIDKGETPLAGVQAPVISNIRRERPSASVLGFEDIRTAGIVAAQYGTGDYSSVPVLEEDSAKYRRFIATQLQPLYCHLWDPNQILWHYTTGDAFLNIVRSKTIWVTHVSCLNDSTEIQYSEKLIREAFSKLEPGESMNSETDYFLRVTKASFSENPSGGCWSDRWGNAFRRMQTQRAK